MKKYLSSLIIPVMLAMTAVPVSAQIQASASASAPSCYTFTRNLGLGKAISPAEASALAYDLSAAGVWSSNTSISIYDSHVADAVSAFQEKYASQILVPVGLTQGTGFVGASTRAYLNKTYGCSSSQSVSMSVSASTPSNMCPAGYTCTPIAPSPFANAASSNQISNVPAPAAAPAPVPVTDLTVGTTNNISAPAMAPATTPVTTPTSAVTASSTATPPPGQSIATFNSQNATAGGQDSLFEREALVTSLIIPSSYSSSTASAAQLNAAQAASAVLGTDLSTLYKGTIPVSYMADVQSAWNADRAVGKIFTIAQYPAPLTISRQGGYALTSARLHYMGMLTNGTITWGTYTMLIKALGWAINNSYNQGGYSANYQTIHDSLAKYAAMYPQYLDAPSLAEIQNLEAQIQLLATGGVGTW